VNASASVLKGKQWSHQLYLMIAVESTGKLVIINDDYDSDDDEAAH